MAAIIIANICEQERAIQLKVEWINKEELSLVLLRQYFIVCSITSLPDHQLFMIHTDIQTNADSNAKFLVRASFLEIYNERISDLMV